LPTAATTYRPGVRAASATASGKLPSGSHRDPTAPALPPALALAERDRRSGADLMLAYQVGVEVECKVAEAILPRHYQTGFHSTATCGTFAAAAATSRLMGLDEEATARALSIAGSQSAGLRENFGTMTKPFHAGRASESGVAAAQFASYGWTATDRILEAPRGFFSAAGGGYDSNAIAGRLGRPWTFAEPGVSIKPHPSGSLTHPGMTEMLRLIREHLLETAGSDSSSRTIATTSSARLFGNFANSAFSRNFAATSS
jgi:2-methylcitrate dehydratase PrpD